MDGTQVVERVGSQRMVGIQLQCLLVAGDWSVGGTFDAGSGTVAFIDGCSTTSSTISDSNTFNDLELETTLGKLVIFEQGETTSVSGAFVLGGTSGNLLQIRSTQPGVEALLDLDQPASGDFVDVDDNHAVGQPVTLGDNSALVAALQFTARRAQP